MGVTEIGVAFAIGSLGLIVAGTVGPKITERIGVGPTVVLSSVLPGLATLLLGAATAATALVLFIIWRILFALGVALYNIAQLSIRQAIIPGNMLGRLTGSIRSVVWGIAPVGAALGAAGASVLSLRTTMWIAGIGGIVTVLPLLMSGMWRLRSLAEVQHAEEPNTPAPEGRRD